MDYTTHGYEITGITHLTRIEPGNIREYRYAHTIVVRWRDAECRPGQTVREMFFGCAASSRQAEHDAELELRRWIDRMNEIERPAVVSEAVS